MGKTTTPGTQRPGKAAAGQGSADTAPAGWSQSRRPPGLPEWIKPAVGVEWTVWDGEVATAPVTSVAEQVIGVRAGDGFEEEYPITETGQPPKSPSTGAPSANVRASPTRTPRPSPTRTRPAM